MLKLLKYDLRRKRERILVCIVITLLIEIAMWVSSSGMNKELLAINLSGYAGLAVAFLFITFSSYFRNLKSYQRRLLPVTPLQTVLSPVLLAFVLLLIVIAIGLVHAGLYQLMYPMDFLPDNIVYVSFRCLLQIMYSVFFLMTMTMFSITAALSLRFKRRVWAGVALLTVLQNVTANLEKLIFNINYVGIDNSFTFVLYENKLRPASGVTIRYLDSNQWPLLFEFAIACLLIYGMTVLVKRRIEV
ncbi:hypothetical protein [Paenibacillus sp. MMS20-IR301]|uniref:hypothetical protein n=1 Tax=Paenibacillus sp. MMS20-IR301 TaxID=2895946 RepID=UPI0028ED0864|nr:hypothetical protein [Paenibacillus sp. MMS20-IR301]WNS45545.1 hypothetical protein LOS79_09830 [Paenibacillus sp. MMS20-IR301]